MNDYGSDFVIITDEDGDNYELEHLFNFEFSGEEYAVFFPSGGVEENDNDIIIFRVVYNGDEEEYENIAEDVYDAVYEKFVDILFETE